MGVYREGLTVQACPGYMNWRARDYRGGGGLVHHIVCRELLGDEVVEGVGVVVC
jgi:hypothetical protein